MQPLYAISQNKAYVDEIYSGTVVKPAELLAVGSRVFDGFLDSLLRVIVEMPRWLAAGLRPLQNGLVQFYALSTMPRAGGVRVVRRLPGVAMNEAYQLPSMLLAVLGLPLLAALAAGWAGRSRGVGAARRTALWFAAAHLILTAIFVVLGADQITNAKSNATSFEPIAVPGDPGLESGNITHATTWACCRSRHRITKASPARRSSSSSASTG